MKRLGIFLTYDKENIIDAYIGYMLKELKTVVSHLVVVCNMLEIQCGQEYIEEYADEIVFRENKGFDAGGFKDALCENIGWDEVLKYDELVLVNDSFFGPFKPMEQIFDEMREREADFWGLTIRESGEIKGTGRFIEEHIQSYFIVVRSRMLHDSRFRDFWTELPYYRKFEEVIDNYELRFTSYFKNEGFVCDCLADMKPNNNGKGVNNFSQYSHIANEMICKRNFPFLKRQQFGWKGILNRQTQENLQLAVNYIDKSTDYDVRLIWENIIRSFDSSDLQRNLCFQYVIEEKIGEYDCQKEDILILVWVSHFNSVEYVLEYLEKLRKFYHIVVLADEQVLLNPYQNLGYETYEYSYNTMKESILQWSSYRYVCVAQDEDMSSDEMPSYHGKTLFYRTWENLLKSRGHVQAIQEVFAQNPYLGAVTLPESNFGICFGQYGREWTKKYEEVFRVAKKLGIAEKVIKEKPPFALFESFWMRGFLLKLLLQIEEESFSVLPYLWPYLLQKAGFYSGIVESNGYAVMNEINLQYYLRQIGQQIRNQYGRFADFKELQELLCKDALLLYCLKYKSVYVYGTGDYATKYSEWIPNIKAFVVSDGQRKKAIFHSKPVVYLSQTEKESQTGWIICLDKKNREAVVPLLNNMGVYDYFEF